MSQRVAKQHLRIKLSKPRLSSTQLCTELTPKGINSSIFLAVTLSASKILRKGPSFASQSLQTFIRTGGVTVVRPAVFTEPPASTLSFTVIGGVFCVVGFFAVLNFNFFFGILSKKCLAGWTKNTGRPQSKDKLICYKSPLLALRFQELSTRNRCYMIFERSRCIISFNIISRLFSLIYRLRSQILNFLQNH